MERLTVYDYDTAQLKKLKDNMAYTSCHDVCDLASKENEEACCNDCPINEAFNRLAAYEDTGLTPEEINKIVSGAPVKVSFDIGDEGFLTAINGAFKERFGITADECSMTISDLQSERDTLKKALELACGTQMEYDTSECPRDLQICQECENTQDSIECRACFYIQQAQEQEEK